MLTKESRSGSVWFGSFGGEGSLLAFALAGFVLNTVLAPLLGLPLNKEAAAEAEKVLTSSLSTIENIWLKGDGQYLLGGFRPSIADLSLVCEIMQLQLLDEKEHDRILGPHKKVQTWIASTRNATKPHFDEVHNVLYKLKLRLSLKQSSQADGERKSGIKGPIISKM
ncbi:glutathione S-transferase t1-like protein [Trifolium pratense]|uniref:Glutathione S-transferase t1-like protein n=3 Tax=Trifolium pratense TaxID=57577 RepID=A0A2K3M843_TRIPR|nr:glutathione S-transferase t1-like protein [Trifolium pratense]